MSKRLLVCPPTHYAINYDINPWMTRNVGYSALICGNLAIVSSFRHPERRREQGIFRAALTRAGLATTFL